MCSGSRTSEGWALGLSGEPGSEKESRTWDAQVISELGFVGVRSWGLSRGLGAVESWVQGLSWAVGSSVASWGEERRRGWGSVREELGSPLLLGSAEAVEDWDGEMISGLASEGSWEVGCFEELVASEGCGVCRGGRPTERDRGWGPGGFSSSACHLDLPGMSGWVGMGRWARCWPLNEGGAGRLDEQMGQGWGGSHQAEAAVQVPSVAAVQTLAWPQAAVPGVSHAQTIQNLAQQIQFFSGPKEAAIQSFLCQRFLGILRAQRGCPG